MPGAKRPTINLWQDEQGFTLPELLVVVVMLVIFSALHSIFDTSIRIFDFGNDKVESVENARLGLEKMEREVRAAYPYNKGGNLLGSVDTRLLGTMGPTEIAFGNDLNGNYTVDADETIRYRLSGSGTTRTLQRAQPTAFEDVVEYVLPPSSSAPYPGAPTPYPGGLRFFYFDDAGGTATSEAQAEVVRIELDVSKDGRVQTLSTDVALRNRGD